MLGKKSSERSEKNVFFIFTRISLLKNGREKPRETIIPETHAQCEQKMLGKESSEKSAINVFLYSHEYRDRKMGGEKKRETIFPETQE